MRLVFLDITCPKPYDLETLKNEPLGGTEATVIRVAEGLANRGHDVTVFQHNREADGTGQARYVSLDAIDDDRYHLPDAVIALRKTQLIPFIKEKWKGKSKLYLWAHDYNQQDFVKDYGVLHNSGVKILGVSQTHKTAIIDALLTQIEGIKGVTVGHIYNPIPDLEPGEICNLNKLVYFSSPHKGLDRAIELTGKLQKHIPGMRLHIANPGYMPDSKNSADYVINHGALPHHKMMELLEDAFCVFHPNYVFPETFGLVYAEANALGVPALTHPIGATREVITGCRSQLVNCRDDEAVIKTIQAWREKRPEVKANPAFSLNNVINQWEGELE